MNKIKYLIKNILFIILFSGCQKNENLPIGDITGLIKLSDVDNFIPFDKSGIDVRLFRDTILEETTVTGYEGTYRFKDKTYGKYKIKCQKENYIISGNYGSGYEFYHIGGESPTITRDLTIYQIPSFKITIDSVKANVDDYYSILIFLKVDGETKKPLANLVGFCSNSPEVSKDNYIAVARGGFSDWALTSSPIICCPVWAYLRDMDLAFYKSLTADTIFIRIYPIAWGQDLYKPINPDALGKPCDVIGFVW